MPRPTADLTCGLEPPLAAPDALPNGIHGVLQQRSVLPRVAHSIRGERDILQHAEALKALAAQCGQDVELQQLPFYLAAARSRSKEPVLLLFKGADGSLAAAVLLCEYLAGRFGSRVFFSMDFAGQRTVIAPAHERCGIALAAARHLVRRGALLAMASVLHGDFENDLPAALPISRSAARLATLQRPVCQVWKLQRTYEETLAHLGQHTRRNFRREPRHLAATYGATYVAESTIAEEEFMELSRGCSRPVSDALARWRFRNREHFPEARLAGLQASNGQWLSVVGLRTQGTMTDVDWQLNRRDLRGTSLVTAMRSCLLRDELRRGTETLRFDGGTSHSMRSVFTEQPVGHLVLASRLLTPGMIQFAASRLLPPDNLLSNVLRAPELRWHM